MTLLYFDGFETYKPSGNVFEDAQDVYNIGGVITDASATTFASSDRIVDGQLLQFNSGSVADNDVSFHRSLYVPLAGLASGSTWIVGQAFRAPGGYSSGYYRVFDWRDLHNVNLMTLRVDGSTGDMQLCWEHPPSPATDILYTDTTSLPDDNAWHYIEMNVTFGNGSAGSVEVHVDGATAFGGAKTGIDTSYSNETRPGHLRLGHMTNKVTQIDDFYICDDQGSVNNDFLSGIMTGGTVFVQRVRPNGATADEDFTDFPVAGSNYLDVAEDTEDGDVSYVESKTVGHKDLYEYENVDAFTVGDSYGVIAKPVMKKTTGGSRTYQLLCKSNVTEENSGTRYPPSVGSYVRQTYIWETDPDAALPANTPWTATTFNAAQFGLEIVS
jgi:hypothetical protein